MCFGNVSGIYPKSVEHAVRLEKIESQNTMANVGQGRRHKAVHENGDRMPLTVCAAAAADVACDDGAGSGAGGVVLVTRVRMEQQSYCRSSLLV